MLRVLILIILSVLQINAELNISSEFYIAGVVEYNSRILSETNSEIPVDKLVQENLNEYIKFIKQAKEQNVDILVFPEATLNYCKSRDDMIKFGIELPNPKEKVAPWSNPNSFSDTLVKLSKEIQDNQIYVLINLIEKEPCIENIQATGSNIIRCKRKTAGGYNIYNSNAVFDRKGRLISRYRKYHLFNEHICDKPDGPTLATFDTDFGVKFGHFICFDIMFMEPALSLVRSKQITNILFPSYWFSELPFLTSVQTHFGWAYANNVNFISAGGNSPRSATSGSGIVAGNKYIGTSIMSGKIEKHLLISQLPKQIRNFRPDPNQKIIHTPAIKYSPTDLQTFKATEFWSKLENRMWNITNGEIQRICVDTNICCTFNIRYHEKEPQEGKISYNYKLVANYTIRQHSHDSECGELYCSIVACTTNSPQSCGRHFKDYSKVIDRISFDRIVITANVKVPYVEENLLIMPNSLDTSLTPLDFQRFRFGKLQSIKEYGYAYQRYQIETTNEIDGLLAFGIFGRNFAVDRFP